MSEEDWGRLEALVRHYGQGAPTQARAYGMALAQLIHSVPAPPVDPGPLDWMDWERRKTIRLLMAGR